MKSMRYEDIAASQPEDIAIRDIFLYSTKVHLVPEWVTERLSVDPYFGAYPECAAA